MYSSLCCVVWHFWQVFDFGRMSKSWNYCRIGKIMYIWIHYDTCNSFTCDSCDGIRFNSFPKLMRLLYFKDAGLDRDILYLKSLIQGFIIKYILLLHHRETYFYTVNFDNKTQVICLQNLGPDRNMKDLQSQVKLYFLYHFAPFLGWNYRSSVT